MSEQHDDPEDWPENPNAGWLGLWAAKQPDLPYIISLSIARHFYLEKRAAHRTGDTDARHVG